MLGYAYIRTGDGEEIPVNNEIIAGDGGKFEIGFDVLNGAGIGVTIFNILYEFVPFIPDFSNEEELERALKNNQYFIVESEPRYFIVEDGSRVFIA